MQINHTILGTGIHRPIDRSSVRIAPLTIVSQWLDLIADNTAPRALPFIKLSHFSAIAKSNDTSLTLQVYMPSQPYHPAGSPCDEPILMAMTVCVSKAEGDTSAWEKLLDHFSIDKHADGFQMPFSPWCASGLHDLGPRHDRERMEHLQAQGSLKDFIDCLAWAWLLKDEALVPIDGSQWPWHDRRTQARAVFFPT